MWPQHGRITFSGRAAVATAHTSVQHCREASTCTRYIITPTIIDTHPGEVPLLALLASVIVESSVSFDPLLRIALCRV